MPGYFSRTIGDLVSRRSVDMAEYFETLFRMGGQTNSGVFVSAEGALKSTTALACTQVLACGLGMLPGKVKKSRADGGADDAVGSSLWELLVDQPNEWQTQVEWTETMVMHAALAGDGISYINRPRPNGPILELIPLLPGKVSCQQKSDYSLIYKLTLADGRYVEVPKSSIFHLRSPSWNSVSGLDASRLAREAIGLSLATEESHARLHSNGARTGGVLSTEQKLDKDDIAVLREQWQQTQGGLANAWKTAILGKGLKWESTAMTGVDSQHIETRKFQIEEICRAFGVFPAIIGYSDKTSTFASAEQFFLAHVVHSLGRWIRRFESRVKLDLMTKAERASGMYYKLSTQALLRGDNKSRSEFYQALVTLGVMTRNEARVLEELNPLPGLDEPLVPVSNAQQQQQVLKALLPFLKSFDPELEQKIGRIISASNEGLIRGARDNLSTVLAQLADQEAA